MILYSIKTKYLEGTILINVGDLLEILSGGNYPATRHRVKIPQVIL